MLAKKVFLVLSFAILLAIWLSRPRETTWIESAHAITPIRTTAATMGRGNIDNSYWLTSHLLLIVTTEMIKIANH